ncbi:hypothetical protein C806_05122 [Lachnospiraceae bacterium 3-1]|nr:hypothetical protein C806_05122 [Lachnospiraceae bacterium 3-1]
MIGDRKKREMEHVGKELDSRLLVSELLDVLLKQGIINFPTYEKARKEVGHRDERTIPEQT